MGFDITAVAATAVSTVSGAVGVTGGPFSTGTRFDGELVIDRDARVPDGVDMLTPGERHTCIVDLGVGADPQTLCVRVINAHGAGRHQDFLTAKSADGAPLHHVSLAPGVSSRLYSSLWLYLAGKTPCVFGFRLSESADTTRPLTKGDTIEFVMSGALSRFRSIGSITIGDTSTNDDPFSARTSGGGIRPLPPVALYRQS